MNLHIGDPCVFCSTDADKVTPGPCPRNMISDERLAELSADVREAHILRTETRLLVAAYRILRDIPLTNAYRILRDIPLTNGGAVMSGWYDDGSEQEFQARRAAKSRYYGLEPREYTCAHCSGDMNKNLSCSHGGSCESIEDFDKRKVRELQESISQSNNGFVALEEATEPVINPELTDEILGWYADGR